MSDNGQDKPKTQEELLQEKKDKFYHNPDSFIDVDTIIMAAVKTEKSVATIINPTTVDTLHVAMGRLADRYRVVLAITAAKQAKNPTILRPNFKPNTR